MKYRLKSEKFANPCEQATIPYLYIKIYKYKYIYIYKYINIREGMREERESCRKEREREIGYF